MIRNRGAPAKPMSASAKPRLEPTRRDARESRARLLEAAGEAFAEYGYRKASLRRICEAAGVNLGAVKYYFGSKQALYAELLKDSHRILFSKNTMPTLAAYSDPEQALHHWIEWFLDVLLSRARHPYLGRIMVREVAEPTPALDELIGTVLINVRAELERIVRAVGGEGLDDHGARRLTNMTLMLCAMHEIGQPVLARFGYRRPETAAGISELADAVARYATGGIRASIR
jgi:AcrR family transcriptional regulator